MITDKRLKIILEKGSAIRAMFELAGKFRQEGKNPIDLSLGNPNIKPPAEYYDALNSILQEMQTSETNLHGYMPNAGFTATRQRVAEDLSPRFGVDLQAKNIIMTAGSINSIDIILQTLVRPVVEYNSHNETLRQDAINDASEVQLDEIITVAPYFVEYGNYIRNNQGKEILVHTDKAFDLDIETIAQNINQRTKAIILNSPNNPTGVIYSQEKLIQLSDLLKAKNKELGIEIAVIEDSPYDALVFSGQRVCSMFSKYENTFYINSFSKSLGLSGERIGYIVVHPQIGESDYDREILVSALTSNLRTRVANAPALQQRIIEKLGCLAQGEVGKYQTRVNKLADVLEKLEFGLQRPQGAFYLFPEIPAYFADETEFRLSAHSGNEPLLYTPGSAFGGPKYERYIRLSACVSDQDIDRACHKLEEMCHKK